MATALSPVCAVGAKRYNGAMRTYLSFLVLSIVIVLGCSDGSGASPQDGGGPDGGGTPSGTASCGQTVTCIAACPANDNACADGCYAVASPNGQQLLLALANCITQYNCQDATCTQTNCSSELTACTQDAPLPAATDAATATGTPLPASLVGTWNWVTSYGGNSYIFRADGSWSGVLLYQSGSNCVTISELKTSVDGVAQLSGSSLTLARTGGTVTTTDCSSSVTTKPATLDAPTYTWSLSPDGLTLTLVDSNGSSVDYKKQ